ncbi:MAG: cobalamin-binding protein [Chloroflexi bacterium]|nr:cobalamin-binding protein [Chloroflexota bacterium]
MKPHLSLTLTALLAIAIAACGPAATPQPTPPPAPTATVAPPTQAPTAVPTIAPSATPAAFPMTFTDSLGRTVKINAAPQRIVSLAPSNTEILFAIGAGSRIVGADPYSDYPPEAKSIARIENYPKVNAEVVVALKPDLVLAGGITNPDDVAALNKLGLTVYTIGTPAGIEAIFASIITVGQLTGNSSRAEQVVTGLRDRFQTLTDKVAQAQSRPKVFYEIDDTDPAKPWTAGPGSFTDVLITLAGGQNIGAAGRDQYFQMSLEEIVSQNPDAIIFSHSGYSGRTKEEVLARKGWENIAAIKNGIVFSIDADIVDRPGPRIVDGLEALAKMIHPELFK